MKKIEGFSQLCQNFRFDVNDNNLSIDVTLLAVLSGNLLLRLSSPTAAIVIVVEVGVVLGSLALEVGPVLAGRLVAVQLFFVLLVGCVLRGIFLLTLIL